VSAIAIRLRPIQADEFLHAERNQQIAIIIQHFIQNTVAATNAEQDYHILIAAPFPMRLCARRADGIAAGRTHFLQLAVALIKPVLALNHERIVVRHMAMQHDLLARGNLNNTSTILFGSSMSRME